MCPQCTFEQYRLGEITQEEKLKDFKICCKCNLQTMRQDKDKTRITDTHVIQYFECDKCGNKTTRKIKLWQKLGRGKNV